MRRAARGPVALGAAALGAAVAVLTVAVHDRWWGWLLGVLTAVALTAAVPPGWWRRLPLTLGWAVTVGWLALPRPGGEYVVAADLPGYLLLAVALALPVAGLLTAMVPPDTRRRDARPPLASESGS